MAQVPLPPPPQTGQPIDNWLYLLWRRLTQAGQILWGTITPGTSADVAAVVTDETGSPGSLVFSGNPTLTGVTVNGLAYVGDTTAAAGRTLLSGSYSTDTTTGDSIHFRKCCSAINGPNNIFLKSRGTALSPSTIISGDFLGALAFHGFDGSTYARGALLQVISEGTISTGVTPASLGILTTNAAGTNTEAFRIDSTQTVTLGGINTAPALKVTPVASQARWIEVTGATSGANPTIGVSGGILAISASVAITGVVSTSGYTVAGLPAGTVGDRAYVTNALAPAYGVAVAGGGAVTIPVFYNGAAWICA